MDVIQPTKPWAAYLFHLNFPSSGCPKCSEQEGISNYLIPTVYRTKRILDSRTYNLINKWVSCALRKTLNEAIVK